MGKKYEVYRDGKQVASVDTLKEAQTAARRRAYYGDIRVFHKGKLVIEIPRLSAVGRKERS